MNTHSREADARLEILAAHGARAGAGGAVLNRVLDAATTEDALDVLEEGGVLETGGGFSAGEDRILLPSPVRRPDFRGSGAVFQPPGRAGTVGPGRGNWRKRIRAQNARTPKRNRSGPRTPGTPKRNRAGPKRPGQRAGDKPVGKAESENEKTRGGRTHERNVIRSGRRPGGSGASDA